MEERLSYRDAITEIESIVKKLESNTIDVDELEESVKRVVYLITFCKSKLHQTEEEVKKVLQSIEEQ